jgi:hypothetical protein
MDISEQVNQYIGAIQKSTTEVGKKQKEEYNTLEIVKVKILLPRKKLMFFIV